MKPRGKKNTSKRKSLKLQHKITKKVAQKNRRIRKDAKLADKTGFSLRKKGSTRKLEIPNNWPFKQQELLLMQQREPEREKDMEKQKQLNRDKQKV